MNARVFVFGTLKEGFPNFGTNRGTRVPGVFRTTNRYQLYLVGPRKVPWMLDESGSGNQVIGQVFEVDATALAAMDALERVHAPDGYRRMQVDVVPMYASLQDPTTVFAYLKPAVQLTSHMERVGPLLEYTAEHAALYKRREA